MTWYDLIRSYYQDWNIYTEEQVYRFVEYGKITQEQADEIVGKTPNE